MLSECDLFRRKTKTLGVKLNSLNPFTESVVVQCRYLIVISQKGIVDNTIS